MEPSRLAASAMDLAQETARGEPVLPAVLELLDRAVGADVLNSSVSVPLGGHDGGEVTMLHAPPLTAREEQEWVRLLPTHPFALSLADGVLRTTRLTDRMSIGELECLEVYELLLRSRGSRYQLAGTLASAPTSLSLLSLWREDRDFTDVEVAVVEVVRRAIAAALAFRSAMAELVELAAPPERVQVLTARQQQVCALVARGHTNAQVATRLGVSERTVRKHLEDVFARSGCANRTSMALWWRSTSGVAEPPLSRRPVTGAG